MCIIDLLYQKITSMIAYFAAVAKYNLALALKLLLKL